MEDRLLNRRDFLRLGLVLTGVTLLTACQKAGIAPTSTAATESTSSALRSGIRLSGDSADAWTHQKLIIGTLKDPAACKAVWIDQGDRRVQAMIKGTSFSATVPLRPGSNPLRAVCQHADNQQEVSTGVTMTDRLPQRPTAIITASLVNGLIVLDGGSSLPDETEQKPITDYIWTTDPGGPATVQVQASADQEQQAFRSEIRAEKIELELPPIDGEYYFSLRVTDEAGREDTSTTYLVVENGRPRIPDYDHESPSWVESAIVYGVIPSLFGSPGTKAIQERLDDLADLGINALWLAPVNATVDYGYSVTDYFELRKSFGSKEDFRNLVQAAHARGIRLLMDFVPNHTSNKHPYFEDTVEKGKDSSYWDFYERDQQGDYTYYFDWTHLPNLNYDNPEVRRMMLEAFSYWVREFDVDGFRVDAAWGVKQRRPDFWPEWRRALKRIKPDLLLLAEASARDPYYFDHGFDAAYDWTGELGHWAWGPFWGEQAPHVKPPELLAQLKTALTNGSNGYHPDALIFRFLNNNDTGTRFISTHGLEMTRVATALLLTLPGIPCIYTADEVGQWFRPYFDTTPISWKERYAGLRDYHKHLIALRKQIPSLHSRLWQLAEAEPASQVIGYFRFLEGGEAPLLVLLNFSEQPAAVELKLPQEFHEKIKHGSLVDLLAEERIAGPAGDTMRVTMPGLTACIVASKP